MKPSIEKVFWSDVRSNVIELNPVLSEIIDRLNPPYPLFKASFPFGTEFIKKGKLYLPNQRDDFVSLTDIESNELKEELGYNIGTNPVSMVLQKSAELFISLDESTLPFFFGFLRPGRLFSTSRVLSPTFSHQPAFLWNITAGARSLFMLPKISDTAGYKRLRKTFHLQVDKPKGLVDHWELFKEIANHDNFNNPWALEVLFFSKRWFDHLNDKAWIEFHRYLLQVSWETTEFWRNRFIWDLVFSYIQRIRGIKPNPYIADTVKHILSISAGAVPGMGPATDDSSAPIAGLQRVFKDIYNLETYLPIILQSKFFSLYEECSPVYYSLQYPTTLEFSSKLSDNTSALSDLYDVKSLLEKYLNSLSSKGLNIEHTPLADIPQLVKFDYFHSDNDGKYRGIRSTQDIPLEDLLFANIKGMKNSAFPLQSTFVRGCIRMSHQEKNLST
ncbi:MAG: hypothetical protein ACK4PR_01545 [Gammaproteobacteria bacterium]